MGCGKKKRRGNSIVRAVTVGISLILQVGWLLLLIYRLNRYSALISLLSSLLAAVVVLRLYSKNTNSAYKIPWIMLIMALPVMGLSLYLMVQLAATPGAVRKRIRRVWESTGACLDQKESVPAALGAWDISAVNQCRYLRNHAGSPVYDNTKAVYYGRAADAFAALKQDLEQAKSFIFLEYFIVEDGESFGELREILRRKVAEGVEVRLLYDDFGSIGYVNLRFAGELNREGIHCRVFNPAVPVLRLFMNHRDHRKIAVIDGKIGYTGGFNLADEYFDLVGTYGDWKDTGIRLEGEGVRSLTATFLELWNAGQKEPEPVERYLQISASLPVEGYVQPFGDNPLEAERTAENAYIGMIQDAKEYVWLMTPYLMITDEMKHVLGLAAKRGVDVRLITPGVPEKKTVYAVTRSYYSGLASQGVRVYEYTPGFLHAKQCIADGKMASIGTSNLDYRSLYLHFENNVMLYGGPAVKQMEQDFMETFQVIREVTEQYRDKRAGILRLWQCVLRLFAPMM